MTISDNWVQETIEEFLIGFKRQTDALETIAKHLERQAPVASITKRVGDCKHDFTGSTIKDGKQTCCKCGETVRATTEPIPTGVYFDAAQGNFYSFIGSEGMGIDFWNKWQKRRNEFPAR